jgi:hypothetical protein
MDHLGRGFDFLVCNGKRIDERALPDNASITSDGGFIIPVRFRAGQVLAARGMFSGFQLSLVVSRGFGYDAPCFRLIPRNRPGPEG